MKTQKLMRSRRKKSNDEGLAYIYLKKGHMCDIIVYTRLFDYERKRNEKY